MNMAGYYALMMLGTCMLYTAEARCGNQDLRDSIGFLTYDRYGITRTEKCEYTFNTPADEDTMLILQVTRFRAFRQGSKQNAFITLPDGFRIHHSNQNHYVNGHCFRYSRKDFQMSSCLEEQVEKYCPSPTTEIDHWPPTLRSVSNTSHHSGNGEYSYDMDFSFFYMYVSCPKAKFVDSIRSEGNDTITVPTEGNNGSYFVITIALGSLLVVVSIIMVIAIVLLLKKYRPLKKFRKSDLEQNQPPNNNAERAAEEEDIYENPITYSSEPEVAARCSTYSHIDINSTRESHAGSIPGNYNNIVPTQNGSLPKQNQVVNNVLYHNM